MDEEYKVIHSPLERRISERGISIEVLIYHGEDDAGWILEVVDHTGGSTVWDERSCRTGRRLMKRSER